MPKTNLMVFLMIPITTTFTIGMTNNCSNVELCLILRCSHWHRFDHHTSLISNLFYYVIVENLVQVAIPNGSKIPHVNIRSTSEVHKCAFVFLIHGIIYKGSDFTVTLSTLMWVTKLALYTLNMVLHRSHNNQTITTLLLPSISQTEGRR